MKYDVGMGLECTMLELDLKSGIYADTMKKGRTAV